MGGGDVKILIAMGAIGGARVVTEIQVLTFCLMTCSHRVRTKMGPFLLVATVGIGIAHQFSRSFGVGRALMQLSL